MPAPNTPNTAPAIEARRRNAQRRRLEAMAAELREAGYTVTPPTTDGQSPPERSP
jgi:hypothetical protein